MKKGDRVYIADFSDAHGDAGTIYDIQDDGLIIVDLGECLWPVFSERDLRTVVTGRRGRQKRVKA